MLKEYSKSIVNKGGDMLKEYSKSIVNNSMILLYFLTI